MLLLHGSLGKITKKMLKQVNRKFHVSPVAVDVVESRFHIDRLAGLGLVVEADNVVGLRLEAHAVVAGS